MVVRNMKKLLLLLLLVSAQAHSWSTPDPRGYWIVSGDAKTLYGYTEFHANYTISQWSIPEELPGFVDGVTENDYLRVDWDKKTQSTSLTLHGAGLPCGEELDGFISPLAMVYSGSLGSVKQISLRVDIFREDFFVNNLACPNTRGGDLLGIVFFNEAKKQLLYYQLRFSNIRMNPDLKYWWRNARLEPNGWTSWGYRDQLFTFRQPAPELGEWTSYELNMTRVLKQLIKKKPGMDHSLKNWRIRSMFYGAHVWGDVDISTRWKNVKITIR